MWVGDRRQWLKITAHSAWNLDDDCLVIDATRHKNDVKVRNILTAEITLV